MHPSGSSEYTKIIRHFGGVAGLAQDLAVSVQAIYLWKGGIPQGRAYQIEVLSGGKFKASRILKAQAKPCRAG